MSLQVITFPDVAYEAQRRGANWIQTLHLPGRPAARRWPPSSGRCSGTRPADPRRRPTSRRSYARTLRAWRTRFLEQLDEVRALGFDERFIRMWEYYLALSEAGFATGLTQDLQIVLEKGRGLRA